MNISYDDWIAQGSQRYGKNMRHWKFRCPACGRVATATDWEQAGAPESAIARTCPGRWQHGGCSLPHEAQQALNPIQVVRDDETRAVFDFADHPLTPTPPEHAG